MKNPTFASSAAIVLAAFTISFPSTGGAVVLPAYVGETLALGEDSQNWVMSPTISYSDITVAGNSTLENWSSFKFQTGCDNCRHGLTIYSGAFINGSFPGVPASLTLEKSTYALNETSGRIVNNGTINNYGQLDSSGSLANHYQIINFENSIFTNRSNGSLVNNGQFTSKSASIVNNNSGSSIENNGLILLEAASRTNSSGDINNRRDLFVSGFFSNAGSINNTSTIKINNDVLSPYSQLVPATGGFSNYGKISNAGNIYIGTQESTVYLGSNPINQTFIFNNGEIINSGTIEIAGKLTNWSDGVINNLQGGMITPGVSSNSEIANYGMLINSTAAYINATQLRNFGNVVNNGIINAGGIYYQNGGNTVNNGLLWASDIIIAGGAYSGNGKASNLSLMQGAEFSPGAPYGRAEVGFLTSYGNFIFDINSLDEYDSLYIGNFAEFFDGSIEFRFPDLFSGKIGDRWDFIFGNQLIGFDLLDVFVTGLAKGIGWEIQTFDDHRSLVITSVTTAQVPEPSSIFLIFSAGFLLFSTKRLSRQTRRNN